MLVTLLLTCMAIVRELTKLHEELFRGTVDEAGERWPGGTRGEITWWSPGPLKGSATRMIPWRNR
jgi:16S rRNA C1402 (ribose-2'-O) methylase RsmI